MGDHEAFDAHLTPEELGAYLDRAHRSQVAARVEDHLAGCAECRREAIALGRLVRPEGGRRMRGAYWIAPAAAAAIAGLLLLGPRAGDVVDRDQPALRADDIEDPVTVTAVAPGASTRLHSDSVVFTWREIEDHLVYQVTLLDEGGAVLWQGTTEDTTIALPMDVSLSRGARFFWYVEALLADTRSASSSVQEFFTLP